MYSNTFSVSSKTNLGDIYSSACKFWGLGESEYSLYLENPDIKPYGVDLVETDELAWTVNALPDLAPLEGEDALLYV